MRKKRVIKKQNIKPDVKYSSILVRRLINKFMLNGEFRKSQKIVYKASEIVEKDLKIPFDKFLEDVINNIKPGLELKTSKRAGLRRKTVSKISFSRDTTIAMQIIKNCVRELSHSSTNPFYLTLANELKGAYNKTGSSIKKRENIRKEAESSRILAN